MVEKILNFFCGYIKCVAHCSSKTPFYVLKELEHCADIYDIGHILDNDLSFTFKRKYKKNVLNCLNSYGCKINAFEEKGVYVLLSKAYMRLGLVVGSILLCVIMYLSSLFIWEIRVVGNLSFDSSEIIDTLRYLGFYEGCLKSTTDLDKLHNDFLLCEKRISWIAVNIKGNIAFVEVSMREFPPERLDKNERNNVIASCDGVIMRVDAYEGGKQVKEGEVVSKGQILISAFFDTKDNNTFFTNARGSVMAKTQRSFEVRVNKFKNVKAFTGKTKKKNSIVVLGKEIPLWFFVKPDFKNYVKEETLNNIVVLGVKMPIKLKTTVYKEYDIHKEILDNDNAVFKAKSCMFEKISKEMIKGDIVSINSSCEQFDDYICLRYTCHCVEDIAVQQPVYLND